MAQDKNIKLSLQLVERLTDHSIQYIPLIDIASVPAQSGAQYAVIDTVTGKSPEGLRVKRRGSSLLVETEDDLVLVEIVDFYEEADAVFIPQAELEGTALAGEFVTSNTPAIDTAANGDELIWQGNSGGELLTPTYLGLGGLALGGLAIAASGNSGGGASTGADTDIDTGESPTVLNTVAGVIVGGPVIEGNDLRVEVYQADGVTKLGEAQVNSDGSFSIAVGSYLGVVIARVVNGGSGADYLDEATQVGKDLNAELFAMEVVTEPNSTVNVNLNVLSTLAYHKVQDEASNGAPTGPMVDSINKGIADLFGLPSLHGLEVVPTNGGRFNSDDGLSAEEMYGALLAALSGADAQNGGDSQQTINDLLAGLTVSNGAAVLTERAQGILVQGGAFTSAQTGDDLTGAVSGVVDTFAPDITSGAMASAIDENSGVRQVVYTAAASDAGNNIVYSLKSVGDHTLLSINASTGAVTLLGNPDHESKASYSFTVVATDAAGNASEQAVSLRINDLDEVAPAITSAANATAINENSGAGQVVYTVTSSDSGDVSTGSTRYSLKAGADAALFSINAATGAVTLTGNPDHESKASYSFTVVATDAAGNASEQAVSLRINDLDEVAPAITSAANATAINENSGAGQVVYTVTSSDSGDVSTGSTRYSLKAGADAALFSINAATGAVTLTGNPDHESKASYSITVVATDAAGNASEQAVSLGINNLDDTAPSINSGATASAIDENSGAGQVVYTVTSTDNADVVTGSTRYSLKAEDDSVLFSINASTGAVTLTSNPDYETKPNYSFTVEATDAAGNVSEQTVTLDITNLDDTAPTITSATKATTINENSGAGQVVYTATSTDNADIATGSTRYSLKAVGDHTLLSINASTGAVTLLGNPDHESKANYSFTIVATDAAGNASEQAVSFGINNLDEVAPTITSSTKATTINENSGAGQVVYTATSTDNADVATGTTRYSLKAVGDHTLLSINANTGAVTLIGNPDFETKASYSFTVVATDAAGNASEQSVSFGINNLDDTAPSITSGGTASAINENSGAGQVVYTATSTDNTDVVTGSTRYSLKTDGDAALFTIDASTGSVTLTSNPDFETKPSYSFTVVATDAAGNASEQIVSLGINNLDDTAPIITSRTTATAIAENSGAGQVVYTVTSSDSADISTGSTRYSLQAGGDAALFTINSTTGEVTLIGNPDYETKASYRFTVVATDAANNGSEQTVTLAINDLLDEVAPTVSSVAISSASGVQNSTLNEGDVVSVTVTMDEDTLVDTTNGTPRVALTIGSSTVYADYVSGSGGSTLVFQYTILADQTDLSGIAIPANALETNGGTVRDVAGNAAVLAHGAVADNVGFLVDTTAPSFSSGATAAAIDENSGFGRSIYTAAASDIGGVTYSLRAVDDHALLTINPGTGEVTLIGNPDFETKPNYNFTVVATDAAGNASEQAVSFAINDLDEVSPTVSSVALTSASGAQGSLLNAGDVVSVTVTMDENTLVTGTPRVALLIGSTTVYADYVSGSGGTALVFNYVIQANQTDANGIAIPINALELHGGTLKDAAGNDAVLIHGAIDDNASYQVDTTAPIVISGAAATAINENSGAGQTVYTAVATDANTVSYSLKTVDDHAAFSIDSASGTVTLNGNPDFETKNSYAFTVIATDAAGNASEQAVALSINDVDDTGPAVSSVAISSAMGVQNNTLNAGDVVSVTVGMNEATLVNTAGGTPRIALTVGGSTVYADYVSGSGTASLVFQYTILAGQTDANGIAIPANGLALNGGTFKDTAGNDAMITHALVADNGSFRVDTSAPTLTSSTPADNASAVAVGANIVLTFNENVSAGSGNIVISNGTDTRTISVNDSSQVSISGSMVTINPTADLNAGSSYNVQMGSGVLTDQAGNAFAGISNATTLNFDTAAASTVNTSIVVFDLVEGVSSSHSSRTFDVSTTYTIYVRVDSNSNALSTDGNGPGASDSWGLWLSANNLGADDKIVLVGTGSAVIGGNGPVTQLINNNIISWAGGFWFAATLWNTGRLGRATQTGVTSAVDLWNGVWAANPNANDTLNQVYFHSFAAAGVPNALTTQGLAGPV
ncbi:cadherin domain-containing protein [Halomonas sp. LY9]